jgi:UDP-2-acetamido-3-amino-2,3-dideoxy-glucuronate N-acetyltransferase
MRTARRGDGSSTSQDVHVHPRGLCESTDVGPGTRVWAFAHVMAGAAVGAGCNIGDHAFIEGGARIGSGVTVKNAVLVWDGVTVGDDVFLGPNMVFTNDLRPRAFGSNDPAGFLPTTVDRGATIGANATIVCGITIGAFSFVAAGAVVHRDVAPHALVVGNPARQVGWVCRCGSRLSQALTCGCGLAYDRHHTDEHGAWQPVTAGRARTIEHRTDPGRERGLIDE